MRPIAADGVAWFVCVCVCVSVSVGHVSSTLQKRLNPMKCKEPGIRRWLRFPRERGNFGELSGTTPQNYLFGPFKSKSKVYVDLYSACLRKAPQLRSDTEGRRPSRPRWLVTYRNKVPPSGVEPGHGHPSQY